MRDSSRKLLTKLANGRPKPSKQILETLFADIQSANIDELLAEFGSKPKKQTTRRKSSPLELHTKNQLRKVSGKVKDFVPYLLEAVAQRDFDIAKTFKTTDSLGRQIQKVEKAFGNSSRKVVDQALERFTKENDTSYRLVGN